MSLIYERLLQKGHDTRALPQRQIGRASLCACDEKRAPEIRLPIFCLTGDGVAIADFLRDRNSRYASMDEMPREFALSLSCRGRS
jgi:hypothetical protein